MRKLLFSSLLLFASLVAQAQEEYTIEGKVEGVKDGTLVSLFLLDGTVGSTVAHGLREWYSLWRVPG